MVGAVAVALGAAVAIYAERGTIRSGLQLLEHVNLAWVFAAVGAEVICMLAFAVLQACLLRAGGAPITVSWLLATAYRADVIASAVPVVGSGMATRYAYRQYRARGVDPTVAAVALTLAGVASTITFAVVVVVAALLSGNAAAAGGGLVGALGAIIAVATVVVALRSPLGQQRLITLASWFIQRKQRVLRRPTGDPAQLVRTALHQLSRFRLTSVNISLALTSSIVNWFADAACLVLSIRAIGLAIPWHTVLVAWSAGKAAGSLSPTPAGLGVVETAMIAALVATGLRAPDAIAAVIVYRVLTFKVVITTIWCAFRPLIEHRKTRLA